VPLEHTPVSTLFTTPDEVNFLEFKAVVHRIRLHMRAQGLFVFDAFRAFNSSRTGLMTCSELFGGLTWLGLGVAFTPDHVHELMRKLATEHEGLLTFNDFKRAFHEPGDDDDAMALRYGGEFDALDDIPPVPIPELTTQQESQDRSTSNDVVVDESVLETFKVKVKPVSGFTKVWDSQGTRSERQASLWSPDAKGSRLRKNKERITLGHYAQQGLLSPTDEKGSNPRMTLEVTDTRASRMKSSSRMGTVLDTIFPHPQRFKESWHTNKGNTPLYAWRAVPPDGYVALGMVITSTDETPDVTAMRCVPLKWVTPTTQEPRLVWTDSGAGGGRPGSIWAINSLDFVYVHPGHEPPTGVTFYELSHQRMMGAD